MAREELESVLRRQGDEQVRELWQQAEAEAARLRSESAAHQERAQQAAAARREGESAAQLERSISAARRQAQQARLAAELALAVRLKRLAVAMLAELGARGGAHLFGLLADEVPAYDWRTVAVHPRDRRLAAQRFKEAEICGDQRISGGLKVADREEQIQIINTLEKRLEHLWPEMLPEMLAELRQRAGEDETAD